MIRETKNTIARPAFVRDEASVGVIVLAAGESSRMGEPKQLLVYQGESLLRRAVKAAVASKCRPVIVVLGAFAGRMRAEIADFRSITTIENEFWAEGVASSIRAGLEFLKLKSENKAEAVVIMLCDQPFVTSGIINRLVAAYRADGDLIVASEYDKIIGVPALFDHQLFSELAALRDSSGAKQIIRRHSDKTRRIAFSRGMFDVDTPQDYARLCAGADEKNVGNLSGNN